MSAETLPHATRYLGRTQGERESAAETGAHCMPRLRRIKSILVRLTPDEHARVAARAREAGRPVARYVREASLGAPPRARRTAERDPVIRTLARVATRLVALAGEAETAGLPSASAYRNAVDALLALVRGLG